MRKLIILGLMLCVVCSTLQAQTNNNDYLNKKTEVRFGMFRAIFGSGVNIGLEFISSNSSSIGTEINVGYKRAKSSEYQQKYSLTPYYRQYFTRSTTWLAKGFFVEGFADIYSYDHINYVNGIELKGNGFGASLGVGLGVKVINYKGFVVEPKVGYGGAILGQKDLEGVTKADLNIGYRF